MADAKAIYTRVIPFFAQHNSLTWETMNDNDRVKARAIIFSACIIAEALINATNDPG